MKKVFIQIIEIIKKGTLYIFLQNYCCKIILRSFMFYGFAIILYMHLFCTQVHLIFITRSNISKKKNINNNKNYFSYLANFFALSSNVRFKMIAKSRNFWRNFAKPRKKEQFEVHCHMLYVIYYAHSYQAVSSPLRPMSITLAAQLSDAITNAILDIHLTRA